MKGLDETGRLLLLVATQLCAVKAWTLLEEHVRTAQLRQVTSGSCSWSGVTVAVRRVDCLFQVGTGQGVLHANTVFNCCCIKWHEP